MNLRKSAQTPQVTQPVQPTELTNLRNSIVKFHQNMKIAYDKLKNSAAQKGATTSQALFAIYKPYFENVAAAPVFSADFTTDQVTQHLHYLEGIAKKLGSDNAMLLTAVIQYYGKQPYYLSLKGFGQRIKETFVSLATVLNGASVLPSDQLITKAPSIGQILDHVGSNFVTQLQTYITEIQSNQFRTRPPIRAYTVNEIVKMAEEFVTLVVPRAGSGY